MANEELMQRGYLPAGKLRGNAFGDFEDLNIGSTSIKELKAVGVEVAMPSAIKFPFLFSTNAASRPWDTKRDGPCDLRTRPLV
jgi:hypothetical protein